MQTMNASVWMEKIGMTLISGLMMAGVPAAFVAVLIQSF
jgi:hypothetical protein